jgi:Flp pilus assembly protein CpaB
VVVFAGALASTRGRSAGYVVASRPLAAGTVVGPGDTAVLTFSLPDASRALAFRDGSALIGRTLAVPVSAGELIEAGMLAPAGGRPDSRPVSVNVDTTSLAGLQAGDPVDVLGVASTSPASATVSGAGGASAPGGGVTAPAGGVTVIVRNAALLSVSRGGSALAPASSTSTVVTLGVANLAEAEMLVQAEHSGTVELVRAEPADGTGPGPAPGG